MELLELIGTIHFQTEDYKIKTAVSVIGIVQKLTQAGLYHFSLRQKTGNFFPVTERELDVENIYEILACFEPILDTLFSFYKNNSFIRTPNKLHCR